MDTPLKIFTYLLLGVVTQSCIPPKTLQHENVLLKRTPELKKANKKDIAEVKILEKEIDPKENKIKSYSEGAKYFQFTSRNEETIDDIDAKNQQKQSQNRKASQSINSMPIRERSTASTTLSKSSKKGQNLASTKAQKGNEHRIIQAKAKTEGSNLQDNQIYDFPHGEEKTSSKYGKKSVYAHGFQPKQEGAEHETEDDIIAKQLKDAASSEADPYLRKKLWYEYERYKSNL